ncbi:Hypothetical protein GLP15_100 [Giardia lamblia P15]|uniref:Uncharacterized protein n=1 Tax=Giardia intestinalis (strain P15) TaxID=658858 RepID=E1EX21_GIAIA|nr:Hypothetical protein GLP15_100 [Giardia lamblia P15]
MDASQDISRRERCLLSEVVYLREMLEALMEEKNDVGRLRQEVRDAKEIISTYEETIKTLMKEVVELRQGASDNQKVVSLQAELIAAESRRIKEVTSLQNTLHKKDREIAQLQAQLAEIQRANLH